MANPSDPASAAELGFPSVTTSLRTALLAVGLVAGPVHAQQETLHLRTLAANCAQCHGTDGRTVPGSALPSIAGMPRDYLLTQLHAFKAGTRPSTIMQQLARGYTDEQLEQLAAFFAAQKP
ncbi:c-type cytochrome [Ramlibacter sp. AN1133]|uniref:c-type cytochrome n=1 Tax=Ramlibacter sp. AN1133 TaxID=3133429 RepID=UPI0030BFF985